jgi:hypothetical protein
MHPGGVVNEAEALPVFGQVWTQVHARPHVKDQMLATHEAAITNDDSHESRVSRGSVTILLETLAKSLRTACPFHIRSPERTTSGKWTKQKHGR